MLAELLERWGVGLTENRAERRIALRLSPDRLRLVGDPALSPAPEVEVAQLPSVRRTLALSVGPAAAQPDPGTVPVAGQEPVLGGEDDEDADLDADLRETPRDYYADVWEIRS